MDPVTRGACRGVWTPVPCGAWTLCPMVHRPCGSNECWEQLVLAVTSVGTSERDSAVPVNGPYSIWCTLVTKNTRCGCGKPRESSLEGWHTAQLSRMPETKYVGIYTLALLPCQGRSQVLPMPPTACTSLCQINRASLPVTSRGAQLCE